MIIVNGKRHYAAEIRAAHDLNLDGWDHYDGQNWQWYTIRYNPVTGLTIMDANNSGSCWGDYRTKYFNSPAEFAEFAAEELRSVSKLLGSIDEDDAELALFVDAIYPARKEN